LLTGAAAGYLVAGQTTMLWVQVLARVPLSYASVIFLTPNSNKWNLPKSNTKNVDNLKKTKWYNVKLFPPNLWPIIKIIQKQHKQKTNENIKKHKKNTQKV
jgi:hypothetical protein